MADMKTKLIDWLRDAHAMEDHALKMPSAFAGRLEHYPELRQQVERHIDETRRQSGDVRACLERLGADTSTMKDFAARIGGMVQGASGVATNDEVMKGALASYAFEHTEIASYRIIAAAAKRVGDPATQQVCERILAEEQAMADWLGDYLPSLTTQFLQREETPGATA